MRLYLSTTLLAYIYVSVRQCVRIHCVFAPVLDITDLHLCICLLSVYVLIVSLCLSTTLLSYIYVSVRQCLRALCVFPPVRDITGLRLDIYICQCVCVC